MHWLRVILLLGLVYPVWLPGQQENQTYWSAVIDNDIPAQTDHQYTAGFTFQWFSPSLTAMPQLRVLPGNAHFQQAGMEAEIMLFTPRSIFSLPPPEDDRPYSATFLVRSTGRTFFPTSGSWYEASLGVGMIGPSSQVWRLQNLIHALTPHSEDAVGWDYQIADAFLLQYELQVQQAVFLRSWMQLIALGDLRLGSGFTDATMGMEWRFGRIHDWGQEYCGRHEGTGGFYAYVQPRLRAVGYDVSLQSSMIGSEAESLYREPLRGVGHVRVGLVYRFPLVHLEIAQEFLSPLFVDGPFHSWGRLGLRFHIENTVN